MERGWCAYMAIYPDQFVAFVGYDAWNSNQYLLTLGKGIYDRTTKEFIACSYVGIQISSIDKELQKYKVTPRSEVSIIVWEETGNIASSTKLNATERDGDIPIYDASLGLTKESYESLFNLVDYESPWSPDEVRQSYTDFIASDGEYFVASYPMPPVPKEYDPAYRPIFLIVTSTAKEDTDSVVQDANDVIDDGINRANIVAIVIVCVGFVVSMIIIIMMARVITSPLRSMNATASEIVNQFGDPSTEQVISGSGGLSKEHCFAPKTELSEVVKEFNEMVVSFSGKAMAKSEKGKQEEVENIFNMRKPFLELYESRNNKDFAYHFEVKSPQNSLAVDHLDELSYRNEGSNLLEETNELNYRNEGSNMLEETNHTKCLCSRSSPRKTKTTSSLFIWITVLIVVPLLVGSILVATLVLSSYEGLFDEFVTKAEGAFLELEASALLIHSTLRADYVGGLTSKSISELHLLTRYTSWLLFGGLNRSDSFTELLAGVENCKIDPSDIAECPFVQGNDACDCDWNIKGLSLSCQRYPNETASRYLQKQIMVGQSTGNPQDGSRNVTLFPNASFSPETTHWFENQTVVPGFERGFFASGYNTTFDRMRQTSAVPIVEALFNYDKEKRTLLRTWTGFEADGMVMGYSGCDVSWAALSSWSSNDENGAYKFRPELCPLGKYGYDPRYVYRSLRILQTTALNTNCLMKSYLDVESGIAQGEICICKITLFFM
jgi:HAMP domain-containing protein